MSYVHKPIWISSDYDQLLEQHGLTDPRHRKLLHYSLVGRPAQERPTHAILPQPIVESIYAANTTLAKVQERWESATSIPIDITAPNHPAGLAATVRIELPEDLLQAHLDACKSGNRDKADKINLYTRERWTAYKERKEIEAEITEAEAYVRTLPQSGAVRRMIAELQSPRVRKHTQRLLRDNEVGITAALHELLDSPLYTDYAAREGSMWLNLCADWGVGPEREQDVIKLWTAARLGIKSMRQMLPEGERDLADRFAAIPVVAERMRCWKRYLRATTLVAHGGRMIQYRGSANSPRIFGVGANLLQLPRSVRKAAYRGCWSIDQSQCQLRIVARIWGVSEVDEYLSKHGSLWANLAADLGVGIEMKDVLKTLLYATVYGGSMDRLRMEAPDLADAFRRHPLVDALWAARERVKREISKLGYIVDCNGEIHKIEDVVGKSTRTECIRSLMARQVQSYELAIMAAGAGAVADDPDMLMAAWMHDGIYVAIVEHPERSGRKMKAIEDAIKAEAENHGIEMEVEIERL